KTGPFEPLHKHLEFRDLVVGPTPGPPLSEMSMTNLSKLARPAANHDGVARKPAPVPKAPAPQPDADTSATAETDAAPHFQLPDAPAKAGESSRLTDMLKLGLLIVVTVVTTMIAARYLLPLLK